MDSILVLGCDDAKLLGFLKKLGYQLLSWEPSVPFPEFLSKQVLDLVLLDGRNEGDLISFCELLRQHEATKQVPLVVLAQGGREYVDMQAHGFARCEIVRIPYTVGTVVSKVATELRLRKIAGGDEASASLGEINARLRDLNARFKKEIEEARRIQRHLIPSSLPDDDRFNIAVSYEPLEEVGGDWYYVRTMPTGSLAVQVADVTGHGLAAAFIGCMTKLAMEASASEVPHEYLSTMNRLMTPNLPEGRFVTMFSYRYNPATGALDYARAGHPPALLLSRTRGKVQQLKSDGFAFGFLEESLYLPNQVQLEVDDVVVAFTDALPEAQSRSGDTYGYARMESVLAATEPSATAADILMAILDDFDDFREGRILKDDSTLIVLKRVR